MNTTKIIGLCGTARSGKDTFFDFTKFLLKKGKPRCERVAFADALKNDIEPFLRKKTGISAWTSDDKEKKIIRPILVAYGEAMREISEGKYWINKIKPKLDKNYQLGYLSVITDVRYENEISFLNDYNGSKCIYIDRIGTSPANSQEEDNDKSLRDGASEVLEWRTFGEEEIYKCAPIVKSFLKKFKILEK
jgi:hypothetical protein|tara:strand:- start:1010 stop:1582 length:573 start_codon:yes stop_codon:yes gene_type:complete